MAVTIRTGRLVLVRNAKGAGQVAVIEGHGGGLVTVRAWHVNTGGFAVNAKSIPRRDVLAAVDPKDERVIAAKAAMKRQGSNGGGEDKPAD